jgi:hypothetical protein
MIRVQDTNIVCLIWSVFHTILIGLLWPERTLKERTYAQHSILNADERDHSSVPVVSLKM